MYLESILHGLSWDPKDRIGLSQVENGLTDACVLPCSLSANVIEA